MISVKVEESFAGLVLRILASTDPTTGRPYTGRRLAELLNVSDSLISQWKSGALIPTLDTVVRLPQVFPWLTLGEVLRSVGVPVPNENPGLLEDERRLLQAYRAAPAEMRSFLLRGLGI